MRDTIARALARLTPPSRPFATTLGAFAVRRRRVAKDRERLRAEAAERDAWPLERWRAWQEERLAEVLQHAATRVPYYRSYWERRRRVGNRTPWDRLENWPLLAPDEVRASARQFVADDAHPRTLVRKDTAGRAGKPLTLWRSRGTLLQLDALAEARARGWHGVAPGTPWARIGGEVVVPAGRRRPPFWIWNAAERRLSLSAWHLAPELLPHYLDALARYRIGGLVGQPAALATLADAALRLGRTDIGLAAAFTTGPVREEQRRAITAAFQCPIIDSWTMTELVGHASRCESGLLHVWPEVGVLEVLGNDLTPAAPGEPGELVGTSLLSRAMPLIRYRTGDRGRLAPDEARCACGRPLPVLAALEPRGSASLLLPDGRPIFSLGAVFYGLPVREAQVVQDAGDHLLVRVAPGVGFTALTRKIIVARVASRLGDVAVDVECLATLPRDAGGQVPPLICRLPLQAEAAPPPGAPGEH